MIPVVIDTGSAAVNGLSIRSVLLCTVLVDTLWTGSFGGR